MIGLRIECPGVWRQRAAYTMETLLAFAGIKWQEGDGEAVICYGVENPAAAQGELLVEIPSLVDRPECLGSMPPQVSGRLRFRGREIPFYYPYVVLPEDGDVVLRYADGSPAAIRKSNRVQLGFDLVASAFYYLSCGEEYDIRKRDGFGRFRSAYSQRRDFLHVPAVDYYLLFLREALGKYANTDGPWGGKGWALFLTHDVDTVRKKELYSLLSYSAALLRNIAPGRGDHRKWAFRNLKDIMCQPDNPYWNFREWVDLEDLYGFRSCFFFLGGRRSGRYGRRYDWHDAEIKEAIREVISAGCEIGLHLSPYAYRRTAGVVVEKTELEMVSGGVPVAGVRNHYLCFDVPGSWRRWVEADGKYDTTLGYNDVIGYRAGTGFPFHPYDLENEKALLVWEVPLVIMDKAIFSGKPAVEEVWDRVRATLEMTRETGSCATLLWHQSTLDAIAYPGFKEIYCSILGYSSENGALCFLGKDNLRGY